MLIFAAILAIFVYGMIAAMLGTILPDLSDRFHLTPTQNGTIAFAHVTWDNPSTQVTTADAGRLIAAAESADGPDVHISLGGQSIENESKTMTI